MIDDESRIIRHLLEVEGEASAIINSAREEADSVIAKARAAEDEKFKSEYTALRKQLSEKEAEQKKVLLEKHEAELESYRQNLRNAVQDKKAFSACLDTVLFE